MSVSTYVQRFFQMQRDRLIRLYYMNEVTGSTFKDHSDFADTANITSITLADNVQANGMNGVTLDGVNDNADVNVSGALGNDLGSGNKNRMTWVFWVTISTAIWEDGINGVIYEMEVDNNNRLSLRKHSTNNRIRFQFRTNGINNFCDADGITKTTPICIVVKYKVTNAANDEIEIFIDGVSKKIITPGAINQFTGVLGQCRYGSDRNDANYVKGEGGLWGIFDSDFSIEEVQRISKI